jgi:thiamine pyrophosphate-dependent acetolactate synthase large subunit-like protein
LNRRGFLKTAAASAAATVAAPVAAPLAQRGRGGAAGAEEGNAAAPVVPRPGPDTVANAIAEAPVVEKPGSDFMIDVLKSLNFEYLIAVPANTFMSLHESLINYGGNKAPEFITATNEDLAAAMAHGYAKIEGKPALTACHGTVGTQHATMGIYDCFCDRAPMFVIIGNHLNAATRRGVVDWVHSAQDAAAIVREFVKWDDNPVSLQHFADSAVRAYKIAMTPPTMPVAVVCDVGLQEEPVEAKERLRIPKLGTITPPAADAGAIQELAKMLVAAENPVIVVERVMRTPEAIPQLVALAETLQCAVVDRKQRMNFPTRHPLEQSNVRNVMQNADLIVGFEVMDFASARSNKPGAKRISISSNDLFSKSVYQDFQRYAEADITMTGDGQATLAPLTEAVKKLITDDRRRAFQERGKKLAEAHNDAFDRIREQAAVGWDSSPISTARLCMEVWNVIKNEDYSFVADSIFFQSWPQRLFKMEKSYHYIGGPGGYGIGWGAPAAVGAALANKKYGRLSINVQQDGDFMMGPGVLWTMAHHKIPLLTLMHNNRAYNQELMQMEQMALRHGRSATNCNIGTEIDHPAIDYAKMAQSMGVWAEGPIKDPKELGPALKRAVEVVKRGEPALLDTWTQPR